MSQFERIRAGLLSKRAIPTWLIWLVAFVDWWQREDFLRTKAKTVPGALRPLSDFLLSGWGLICLIVAGFISLYCAIRETVPKAARESLAVSGESGATLYNKVIKGAEDVEMWRQDYYNWRGSVITILHAYFPYGDEIRFRKSYKKALAPLAEVTGITDTHIQLKREFKRDLNLLEKISHRHDPPGLPHRWDLPWHVQ